MKQKLSAYRQNFEDYCQKNKKYAPVAFFIVFILALYIFSKIQDNERHIYHHKSQIDLKGGRILGNNRVIYQRKERVLSNKIKLLERTNKEFKDQIERINGLLLENKDKSVQDSAPEPLPEKIGQEDQQVKPSPSGHDPVSDRGPKEQVLYSDPPTGLSVGSVTPKASYEGIRPRADVLQGPRRISRRGPSVISFPVQSKERQPAEGVKIPAGSYVKAKLLTGVEAVEGRAVPVLLQADYAFIGPNKTRIDLSGCFLIAKSKGNLSIERVEMQATKISCVSKSGRMFERSMDGFIADGTDSAFGALGKLQSKRDRVAAMGFLASIVEGVGKAIQQAQTQTQANAMGGTTAMISGNQAKYMAAGGVSNAAGRVTEWYLKHAENLLPAIAVGSGQELFIIVQSTVDLPNWYFRKEKAKKRTHSFSYLSRLID